VDALSASYSVPGGAPLDAQLAAETVAVVTHNSRILVTPLPAAGANTKTREFSYSFVDALSEAEGEGETEAGSGSGSGTGPVPLHELDLSLLASVERAKVGNTVGQLLPVPGSAEEATGAADAYAAMVGFCGRYGGAGARRFDVKTPLGQAGVWGEGGVDKDKDKDKGEGNKEEGDKEEEVQAGGSRQRPGSSFAFDVYPPAVPGTGSGTDAAAVNTINSSGSGSSSGSTSGSNSGSAGEGLLSVVFLVDPLTIGGQRAASVIEMMQTQLRLPLTVVLLPNPHVREFPLR
jgi:hypothetical protein